MQFAKQTVFIGAISQVQRKMAVSITAVERRYNKVSHHRAFHALDSLFAISLQGFRCWQRYAEENLI